VIGILHVRDVLRAEEEGLESAPVRGFVKPAFYVPETQTTSALLARMRTRNPLALVVDEYGGLAGLVTLEDLLEEIVGDIRDEHEPDDSQVQQAPDGSWVLNGLAHVEELERLFDVEVKERDFDTVGGLVVAMAGRVPSAGEAFETHGLRIEVLGPTAAGSTGSGPARPGREGAPLSEEEAFRALRSRVRDARGLDENTGKSTL